jgi:DNA-binding winged helix-turn-helix (wHTH) protein/Tol biopolymer transport system component
MNNKTLYDFEGFRVDTNQKCLWRGEDIVSLTPKAFDTLLVLIRNNGNIVTKDTILDEVWKDTFVEEATLAQNISTLRKTLAKYDKDKEFIATIPRRGYRFVADVTEILADEEVLLVEKHSVTHIVTEQEQINDSDHSAASSLKKQTRAGNAFANKKLLIGLPLALIALILAGILAISYFSRVNNFYSSKFEKFRVNSLYTGADVQNAFVSPDGKYIAVIERKSVGDSILLKPVKEGNTIQTLPNTELLIIGGEFSPNSESVFYTAYPKENTPAPRIGKLYKIPILGGASQEILSDIDSPVAISETGGKLAFIRNKLEENQSVLITADATGKDQKEIAIRDLGSGFSTYGLSWSPDEKLISTVIFDGKDEKVPTKVLLINAENGEQQILTKQDWFWIGKTKWLKDSSGIALVAYGTRSPNLTDEIWFVSYPEGAAKVITNGLKGVNGISLTDDLDSIIATKSNRITTSYVSPIDNLDDAKEITKTADEASLLPLGAVWTKDEKIIYAKTKNGNSDIWMMNSDGTEQKQLTSDASADYAPGISADGKYIYFLSNRNGTTSIWRIGINGDNPTQITKVRSVSSPTISTKDDFLYYTKKAPEKFYGVLWRSDLDGKNPKQITSKRTYAARVSPDGKYIFCFYPDEKENADDLGKPLKLTLLSTEDGRVLKQFASLKRRRLPLVHWTQNSQEFLIIEQEGDLTTLFRQNIEQDEPEKIKQWQGKNIYQIAVSIDGKKLFYEKGEEVNSVIQLKDISGE